MNPRSSISFCKTLNSILTISKQFSTSITKPPIQFLNHTPSIKTPNFPNPTKTLTLNFQNLKISRTYSSTNNNDNEMDKINLKFAEAREEIESAMDSKETVYFNEEAECARAAVTEVLEMYEGLLSKVSENEKASIRRSMGLKIEQLKAELEQLNE